MYAAVDKLARAMHELSRGHTSSLSEARVVFYSTYLHQSYGNSQLLELLRSCSQLLDLRICWSSEAVLMRALLELRSCSQLLELRSCSQLSELMSCSQLLELRSCSQLLELRSCCL